MVTATTSTQVGSFLLPYDPSYIYRVVAHYWESRGGSSRDRGLSHLRGVDSRTRNEKVLSLATFSGDVLWGHSSRTGRVAGPLLTMAGTSN